MPNAFVDTNIQVCAAEEIEPLPRKTRLAHKLLSQRDLFLSVQVLHGFVANARGPKKRNLNRAQESDWLSHWLAFSILPLTANSFIQAIGFHLRDGLSHWKSLMVACANKVSCEVLYSEVLNHGQTYGTIRVVHPFRDA